MFSFFDINLFSKDCPLILQEISKKFSKPTSVGDLLNFGKRKIDVTLKKDKLAVRNMTLGFKNGEIFGLLGPNGAGKTTTISIVTTEIKPDTGFIKICNQDLNLRNLNNFCKNVGLCPQNNPFWEEITLREHLYLYACIKKVPEAQILKLCNEYLSKCIPKLKNIYILTLF